MLSGASGAVVGVFYGLAYLGMFAPYLLGAAAGLGLGATGALVVAAGCAVGTLAVITLAGRVQVSSDTGTIRRDRG